jgi:hypothetical protein
MHTFDSVAARKLTKHCTGRNIARGENDEAMTTLPGPRRLPGKLDIVVILSRMRAYHSMRNDDVMMV